MIIDNYWWLLVTIDNYFIYDTSVYMYKWKFEHTFWLFMIIYEIMNDCFYYDVSVVYINGGSGITFFEKNLEN